MSSCSGASNPEAPHDASSPASSRSYTATTIPTATNSPGRTPESAVATDAGLGDGSEYGPAGGRVQLSDVPIGRDALGSVSGKWCEQLLGDPVAVDAFTMGGDWDGTGATWLSQHWTRDTIRCMITSPAHGQENGISIEVGFPPAFNRDITAEGSNGALIYAEVYNDVPSDGGNEGVDEWIALIPDRVAK